MAGRTKTAVRFAVLSLVIFAAACSKLYRNHGYVPDENELAQIEIGRDTRETVAQKIGRPTAQGLLNDVGWFYVQSRFEHYGPQEPQEVDRQVVAVNFSQSGVVTNIGRYGLEDGRVIEFSRRVTQSNIAGVSFIGQLLGSVGRLDASQMLRD